MKTLGLLIFFMLICDKNLYDFFMICFLNLECLIAFIIIEIFQPLNF